MHRISFYGIAALFLLMTNSALAATIVTDNITSDTTLEKSGSPYIICSDMHVYPDITLTIEPGVIAIIAKDATLLIGGTLIAIGTPEDPITFTSDQRTPQTEGPWKGIEFVDTAVGASLTPTQLRIALMDCGSVSMGRDLDGGNLVTA
ncbi:MAG: hypothetical protein P8010_16895 [Desulfosarcinaceae bacterium]